MLKFLTECFQKKKNSELKAIMAWLYNNLGCKLNEIWIPLREIFLDGLVKILPGHSN